MVRPVACVFATALIAFSVPASAHVLASPEVGTAGAELRMEFVVGHGCGDGDATTGFTVTIPDGVLYVRPQVKPGWTITVKNRKLDPPLKSPSGKPITETVGEIAWRGGPLPDAFYDTFGVMMKLPDAVGQTLYFPTVQFCEHRSRPWTEVPAAGQTLKDVRDPAPFVKLVPPSP